MTEPAKIIAPDEATSPSGLLVTAERVELRRSGARVTSVRKDAMTSIRVTRASASEQPTREAVWGIGLGAGGGIWLAQNLASGEPKTGAAIAAVILSLLGAWVLVHAFRRVPLLEVRGGAGYMKILLDPKTEQPELIALEARLRAMGYPVL
jgi:hypothetical protein